MCQPCEAGSVNNGTIDGLCTAVGKGQYAPLPGAKNGTVTPKGTYQPEEGSDSPGLKCPAGKYCPAGSFAAAGCAANTFSLAGWGKCNTKVSVCPAGKEIKLSGLPSADNTCETCDGGKYKTGTNANACLTKKVSCAGGKTLVANASKSADNTCVTTQIVVPTPITVVTTPVSGDCTGCAAGTSGPCKVPSSNVCGSKVNGVCPVSNYPISGQIVLDCAAL